MKFDSNLKTAFVLSNLGTPSSHQPKDVGLYLSEFLMDKKVIPAPYPIRWMLVNVLIVPRRKYQSAEAYEKVWMKQGSPLLVHSENLVKSLHVDNTFLAMRYGQPSIAGVVEQIKAKGFEQVVLIPLYPQYADATTGSTILKFREEMKEQGLEIPAFAIPYFFDDEKTIDCFAKRGEQRLKDFQAEHVLFSFHGLPESMLRKADKSGQHCLKKENCCEITTEANLYCYRRHCVQTAHSIARKLKLPKEQYTITFQSRLGPTQWVRPYTDKTVESLAQNGCKRLAIYSPSFVADCLETLEEIAIGLKESFVEHGGEDLILIPSLNSDEDWVKSVENLMHRSERFQDIKSFEL